MSMRASLGAQTGPRHGFHQCGIKLIGSDTVSPYISTHDLYMLATALCLYAALLLVELMLTAASRLNSAPAERMLWPCLWRSYSCRNRGALHSRAFGAAWRRRGTAGPWQRVCWEGGLRP